MWRRCDSLETRQATGSDATHSVFLLCLSALPNMATCREQQTARLTRRDARLLYIMFLAYLGFFHRSLSYSKQSRAVQVLLIPRPLQTNLLLWYSSCPSSPERPMKDNCRGTYCMLGFFSLHRCTMQNSTSLCLQLTFVISAFLQWIRDWPAFYRPVYKLHYEWKHENTFLGTAKEMGKKGWIRDCLSLREAQKEMNHITLFITSINVCLSILWPSLVISSF